MPKAFEDKGFPVEQAYGTGTEQEQGGIFDD